MSPRPAVALFQPSIPPNTGNIGRLCVGFGVELFLIKPLAFDLSSSQLKRAGLDYWPHLRYTIYEDFSHFHKEQGHRQILVLSKLSSEILYDFPLPANPILLMGNEIKGVPESLTQEYHLRRIAIPILGPIRSYNLANATAMALSEAYRQLRWESTKTTWEKTSS